MTILLHEEHAMVVPLRFAHTTIGERLSDEMSFVFQKSNAILTVPCNTIVNFHNASTFWSVLCNNHGRKNMQRYCK